PVPDRKGSADRSVAKRGVAENSVCAAPGKSARLPAVCPVGFAPGEFWTWQYRLGGRLQGAADAFCPARFLRARPGLLRAVAKTFRRIRRRIGRLARPVATFPDDVGG